MNKYKTTAVAVMAAATLLATPALADSPGQLQGGSPTYKVKNITQNGVYADSVSAVNCGDEIKYSINLHNTEFGALTNVTAKTTLGSTSVMTATTDQGGTTGTTGTVTVALANGQTLSYENGSTQLYNAAGAVIKNLPDTIVGGGVNVGTLNGSTTEFVNFKAKVNCAVIPTSTPAAPVVTTPAALPQTGVEGAGLAGMAGTGAVGYAVAQYRRSRKALASKMLVRK